MTDAFPLPVEGTETRVNAQEQAYEYVGAYIDAQKAEKRPENIVGWYHSHPGYGCWLSGIDVDTQMNQQKFTDPFLAVVIDPDRTISAGKVDIGAFRTYPEGYKGKGEDEGEYQTIPLAKIEDFGAHTSQYDLRISLLFKRSGLVLTLQKILLPRSLALQILTRYPPTRPPLEQILGLDSVAIPTIH